MTALTAGTTYAYVYDWTTVDKTEIKEFQPVALDGSGKFKTAGSYYKVTTATIDAAIGSVTAADESVNHDYLYFTRTRNDDGTTYTYSYVSVAGKTTLPAGLIKIKKDDVTTIQAVSVGGTPDADTFYFDTYYSNDGKYAVKVIKIVS